MSSEFQQHQNNQQFIARKKRGQSKYSKQTPKYQCYCDKIYLSYPALYLHLKNKHPECFLNNRKIQVTKFKQCMSEDGFKILKMQKQKYDNNYHQQHNINQQKLYKNKQKSNNFNYENYGQFPFPNKNNIGSMGALKPYFPDNTPNNKTTFVNGFVYNTQFIDPSRPDTRQYQQSKKLHPLNSQSINIIKLLNQYFNQNQQMQQLLQKQQLQIKIIFQLLVKCIKQKTQEIKGYFERYYPLNNDDYDSIQNFVATQKIKYLECVLPYFRNIYLKEYLANLDVKIKNGETLTKEDKSFQILTRNSNYFADLNNSLEEIIHFQNWLIENKFIQKVQENVDF